MEHQDDMASGLDSARTRLVQELVKRGWLDDPRDKPQRNSAQAFVKALQGSGRFKQHREIVNDEVTMIPDLLDIILRHNHDPHDTDLVNTVIDLLDYIWNRVL
jgi:hypothetical protein